MIVKIHEGHVICHCSTAFKVHYNQKLGDPFGHLGGTHHGLWGIDAPADDRRQTIDGRTTTNSEHEHEFTFAKNQKLLTGWRSAPKFSTFK